MMKKFDLKSGEVIAKEAAFHSKTEINLEGANSNKLFLKMNEMFWSLQQNFKDNTVIGDSVQFLSLDLHTVSYEPLGGSSYIPLQAFLAAKKAIINLKNEDDEYYKWAITRALNPKQKHSERINKKLRETSKVRNCE